MQQGSKDTACIIIHSIQQDSLGYQAFGATYFPEKFEIFINDQKLEPGKSIKISFKEREIRIKYRYLWQAPVWGKYENTKEEIIALSTEWSQVALKFLGWNSKNRFACFPLVKLKNAKPDMINT